MKANKLIALSFIGATALFGCRINQQRGIVENHQFEYSESRSVLGRPTLSIYSNEAYSSEVKFKDDNADGRFDNIALKDVRKGDPVEKYANLEVGQKILEEILKKKEKQ